MGSTVYIGRGPVTQSEADYGQIAAGQMRACVFDALSQAVWIYRAGVWCGRSGGSTPTVRVACYLADLNNGMDPGTRLGYFQSFSASVLMADIAGGAAYERNLEVADQGAGNLAILALPGQRLAGAILATSAGLGHSMRQAAAISAQNEKFYNRSGLSQPPPNPFGSFSSSTEGHLTLWFIAETNDKPETPSGLAPSGTISTLTPQMEGNYRDKNAGDAGGTDRGDYLVSYQLEVRRQSDGAMMWQPAAFTASSSERTNKRFSRAYGGSALVSGTTYEWRCRTKDRAGAWSSWTAWTAFTPASIGTVTLSGTPTGKQTTVTPGPFQFSWSHPQALQTNAVNIRLKQGTTVVRTSGTISKTVNSESSGSISWAETGWAALSWGTTYSYEVRARDTNGQWSAWSAGRTFFTNAAPNVPSSLAPSQSSRQTTLPKLRCRATDPDDSTASLVVTARLKSTPGINNPSFDGSITGWTRHTAVAGVTETFTYDSGQDYDGIGGAGRVDVTANTLGAGSFGTVYRTTERFPVVPGQSYTFQIAVRTSNVDLTPRAHLQFYDSSDTIVPGGATREADWTPTANQWSLRTFTVTAPANSFWVYAGVELFFDTAGATGTVWMDAAEFVGLSVRRRRTMTYNSSADRWEYQTTSDDLAEENVYVWDAYSFDGTLYSGAVTSEASAVASAEATFVYGAGPTVTVTSPTNGGTIDTAGPTYQWTVSGGTQQQERIRVWQAGDYEAGRSPIYDSGWVTSSSPSFTQPLGYLRNGQSYDLIVAVKDTAGLEGQSAPVRFTVQFTPPAALTGIQADTYQIGTDPWPTAIRVAWDPTEEDESVWTAYLIYRDDLDRPLARIEHPAQTAYVDPFPVSGREHTYRVTQAISRDGQEIESDAVATQASITLGGVVLVSVASPLSRRATLLRVVERRHESQGEEVVYRRWGDPAPTTIRMPASSWMVVGTYQLRTDEMASAQQRRAELEALWREGGTLCYRDERGVKRFVTIPAEGGLVITDLRLGRADVELALREEAYEEGVR